MKIAIILSRCHNFGSSRYVIETAPYFASHGHEVHIFCNSWDPIESDNVFFHKTPTLFHDNLIFREATMTLTSTLHQLVTKHKADVTLAQPTRYFTPDVGELQYVYASWINYKKSIGFRNPFLVNFSDAWLQWMERRNMGKAVELIALSESVKNDVSRHYGKNGDKVNVCHSGVNVKEFYPDRKKGEHIRALHGIGDEKVLLFVGNPFVRKGLDAVIDALPMVNGDFRLIVAGKDDSASYRERLKKMGLEGKVIFTEGFTRQIADYFSASDIFVFPTLYEPFGLVILEAMASGLPVITSSLAGASELIENGKDGMILKDPKDPEEISSSINRLLEDGGLARGMGKRARGKAEQYPWGRTAKSMLEVLERVAEDKKKVFFKYTAQE